ncbi:2-deoxy-D-gluconate 3-dehydrogenase [Jejuia pallidilutea]|uniref:2-deoxy-D-gluconate 3-dehydrogenase n=1 Tax=Jejuia pallidilutea TaxID=504487 RepID=A0A090W5T5_9FLAO|nr:2-deoxy-D-gluconate 3-dehydrogenase [Jejuia pallidilutea]GAL70814.1 2-deoxy-D-gluconate 3-dehydrogenase [Jejuia pallidilutea]
MSINLFDLKGKTALITGAVHGLGMAMAKGIGHAGATIVVNNYSEDSLHEAVEEYKSEGLMPMGTYLTLLMKKQ